MKRNTRQLHALSSNLATNEKKLLCEAVIRTKKSYIVIRKRRSKFDTENGISRASAKYALDCVGNRFQLNLRPWRSHNCNFGEDLKNALQIAKRYRKHLKIIQRKKSDIGQFAHGEVYKIENQWVKNCRRKCLLIYSWNPVVPFLILESILSGPVFLKLYYIW